MAMSKHAMLIFTSATDNNNKFYEVTLYDNGTLEKRWGRVGQEGQKSTESGNEYSFEKTVKAKTSKGYVKTNIISTKIDSGSKTEKMELDTIAKKDLSFGTDDPEDKKLIESLVDLLVQSNRHQIYQSSNGQITIDESGVIKTPLGLVNSDTIKEARKLLEKLDKKVVANKFDASYLKSLEEYLSLIPQKVPAQRGWGDTFFTSFSSILNQGDFLDRLESSLDLYAQKKKDALDKALKDGDKKIDDIKLFDCVLKVVRDKDVFDKINKMYLKTSSSNHSASRLKLKRVYEVHHEQMKKDFAEVSEKIGNVQQLWHGSRMFNILSILKSGMIIAPQNSTFQIAGRLFGNGIYLSDQSTKSLNYSYGYWDSHARDNHCFMFLTHAALGKEYLAKDSDKATGYRNSPLPYAGYDSTYAKAGVSGVMNNEMIIYDKRQLNLSYLCEFSE